MNAKTNKDVYMSDLNVILGVEAKAENKTGAAADPHETGEALSRSETGWERCAGVFQFAAIGMVYFALTAGRTVSVGATCPLGFIMSVVALDRGVKEGRGFICLFAALEILFFLIFAAAMQGEVENAIRLLR